MRVRQNKVDLVITKAIDEILEQKLSPEEVILVISGLLTRIGYSFYYLIEQKDKPQPQKLLTPEEIKNMWLQEPTVGTSLLMLGCDVQEIFLKQERKRGS